MSRSPGRHWTIVASLGAAAVVLTACGGSAGSAGEPSGPSVGVSPSTLSSTTGQAPPAESAAVQAPPLTPQALAFTAQTVDGDPFDAAALAGKPVVFWFWAPWCTVCRAEAPDAAKIAAEFKDRVTFIGIAGLGPVNDMQAFVSETRTGGFTHLADVDGSLWARFGVVAQPSFVFVTAAGEAEVFAGGMREKELRDVADRLLVS